MLDRAGTFKAGAARIEITPKIGCWLEGIPRARPSDALHDPLYARALVLEDTQRLCLVACDLIALTDEYARSVRQKIGAELNMSPHRVILACSHNHSGPALIGFDNPAHVDETYLHLLSARLLQVCREAAGRLEPALPGSGRGQETTISEYRRLWTRDGRIVMNWEEFSPDNIIGPAEEGDPEVGVVKIEAAGTGRVIAVIFNYACHPNSLPGDNFTITSDFPGYAAGLIEETLGGVALFTNGAQGSVDIEGFVDRDFYGVERRGQALGQAVLDICRQIEVRPEPALGFARQVFLLPYRQVPAETLAWAREIARTATGEDVTLRDGISDELKAGNILWLVGRPEPGITFEMLGLRLGGSVFLTIPGELFTEIGRSVKALPCAGQIYIIGLANGYCGYLPTARASREGGYATDAATGAYFTERAEDLIRQNARILLTSLC